jgi:hypothetical protein
MTILDEAQLKTEMRAMYRDLGTLYSLQCAYEMLVTAKLLLEIIKEEVSK